MRSKPIIIDAGIVVFCFVVSGLVSLFLGQDCNYDLKNYHYYNAYAFLHDRLAFDIVPAQLQTFLNPVLHVPFYVLVTHVSPKAAGFLIGGVQGINGWLVYKIAYHLVSSMPEWKRRLVSLAAGTTGYCGAANLSEIGTVMGDNIISLFVLGSMLLIVSSLKHRKPEQPGLTPRVLLLSGFLAGIAVGLKMVAALYLCSFLAVLLLVGAAGIAPRLKNTVWYGAGAGLGVLAVMGHWMVMLNRNFQNPIFPFYNHVFRSAYYEMANFADTRFLPRNPYQTLFYPFYFGTKQTLVAEMPFRDIRFAVCYVLLAACLGKLMYAAAARRRLRPDMNTDRAPLAILLFVVVSYLLWQAVFSIYRYAVPLELLAPVAILAAAGYLVSSSRTGIPVVLILFLTIAATLSPLNWGRTSWGADFFDVRVPPVANLDRSIVLMAQVPGPEPAAYVIPSFPETTRFVNVDSNFKITPAFEARIQSVLADRTVPLYLLLEDRHRAEYAVVMKRRNLSISTSGCDRIPTKFSQDLTLCELRRGSS